MIRNAQGSEYEAHQIDTLCVTRRRDDDVTSTSPTDRATTGGDSLLAAPAGFGVLTTTGPRTGRPRRKCIRAIRRGEEVYVVMLGPALTRDPEAVSAWLWNIRANPNVTLRIRGGTFTGVARELEEPPEQEQAREAYCETVHAFDYAMCLFHRRGRPTRAKIQQMTRHWFDAGIPLVVDLMA
jgi:deazaflavin-dependent oxidoreductase (nitroreductase family)